MACSTCGDYSRQTCSLTCSANCGSGCASSCSGGCGGNCVGYCSSECGADCATACTRGCQGCSGSCSGTCTGGCSGGCNGCSGCGNGCVGGCSNQATYLILAKQFNDIATQKGKSNRVTAGSDKINASHYNVLSSGMSAGTTIRKQHASNMAGFTINLP